MAGRNSQVARFYKILTLLEGAPHGLTVTEILSRLQEWAVEVTERTVYRDLEGLKDAGFPLESKGTSVDGANRWTLDKTTKITEYLVLNAREVLALFLARNMMAPLRDTPFYQDLENTFAKIEGKIGTKMQNYLNDLSQELAFEPGPSWGLGLNPEVIDTCRTALLEKQKIRLRYFSVRSNQSSERTLAPHVMYFAKGSLYLLARDLGDDQVKIFAMPRMSEVVMLDEGFEDEEVDPELFFENSFGVFRGTEACKIELIFKDPVATFVRERRWHASQRITQLPERGIRLEFDCAVTPELVQWVLGFGEFVQIKGPDHLKAQVLAQAQNLLANHTAKAG